MTESMNVLDEEVLMRLLLSGIIGFALMHEHGIAEKLLAVAAVYIVLGLLV